MANPYKRADRFSKKAREQGYAARSVFKLQDIDRRFQLLRRGQRVVDLGCSPGSWSRYVLERIGADGRLVGVDIQEPEVGLDFLHASVLEVEPEAIAERLAGPADLVLSDMAPATTGIRDADHFQQIELARRALELAVALLRPGGAFVVKVFEGQDAKAFENEVRAHFGAAKRVRPEAVRKQSREFFLVATGFRGP